MSLQNSLTEVFSNCQLNYKCCLLTIGINTFAVIKNSEQSFKIFDAHFRDLHRMSHSFGKCRNWRNWKPCNDLQNVHESPKIEHLPFRNKRNQTQHMKRKQKSLTETPEEKEKQVIARHEYEKWRRVNESEESREKRLAQQHLNREKKRANESSESRKKRLATQSQYQRQKIANESAECREKGLLNQRHYQDETRHLTVFTQAFCWK